MVFALDRGFWLNGIMPVVSAAFFQIAIMLMAKEDLGTFFVFQSATALGIAFFSLQPRAWSEESRTPQALQASLLLVLVFLFFFGLIYMGLNGADFFLWIWVFWVKKICDAFREYFFISEEGVGQIVVWSACLEWLGILALLLSAGFSLFIYVISASLLAYEFSKTRVRGRLGVVAALRSFSGLSLVVSATNLGSRMFLLLMPDKIAHLIIGALLQACNFMAPFFYKASLVKNLKVLLLIAFVLSFFAFIGAAAIVWYSGNENNGFIFVFIASMVTVFNSIFILVFFRKSSWAARISFAAYVLFLVGVSAIFTRLGCWQWEAGYLIYSVSMMAFLSFFVRAAHKA